MKTSLRLIAFILMVVTLLSGGALAQQTRTDYSGAYTLAGKNPDGSNYTGSMTVTPFGDGYRVTAVFGNETWRGIANDIGDYLAVAFLDGTDPVISIYKVSGNNTLEGFWQSAANAKEGSEIATLAARRFSLVPSTPTSAARYDYSGVYNVAGKNPDGSSYTGSLSLTPFGDGYKATFVSGNETWNGVASDFAGYLAVSFNAGNVPSVNIYELQRNGSLVGYWQDFDSQKEGQETATKR
ncbi:MAG: hypothetical protein SFU83_18000 [Meiothermus sp.]|nr:hypothetical protein [Meiothermus sp.]